MDLARLDAVPLLAALPFADRAALASCAREATAEAGDVLVGAGVLRYELLAIEQGEAELYRDSELVQRLSAGDVFGEIGALERSIATATVVALTQLRLITISELDMRRLRRRNPALIARLQGMMLRRHLTIVS